MSCEVHVRICESVGGKFPGATRLVALDVDEAVIHQVKEFIARWLQDLGLELKPSKTQITHTLNHYNNTVGFDFLGFHFHRCKSWRYRGRAYCLTWPSGSRMLTNVSPVLGSSLFVIGDSLFGCHTSQNTDSTNRPATSASSPE